MKLSKHSSDNHSELQHELISLIMLKISSIIRALLVDDVVAWQGALHKADSWRPVDQLSFEKLIKQISPLIRSDPDDISKNSIDSGAKAIMEVN